MTDRISNIGLQTVMRKIDYGLNKKISKRKELSI